MGHESRQIMRSQTFGLKTLYDYIKAVRGSLLVRLQHDNRRARILPKTYPQDVNRIDKLLIQRLSKQFQTSFRLVWRWLREFTYYKLPCQNLPQYESIGLARRQNFQRVHDDYKWKHWNPHQTIKSPLPTSAVFILRGLAIIVQLKVNLQLQNLLWARPRVRANQNYVH